MDEVLNPPLVSDLIDLEQAERDALVAEKAAIQQQLEQLKALMAEKEPDKDPDSTV